MTQPDYTFWKAALAGKKPPMSEGSPEPGFYRMRSKNKQTGSISWQPVAYWLEGNKLHCMIGEDVVSEQRGQELWTFVGQFPVTEQAYRDVTEKGKDWPDQDSIVASQTTPGIGDNSQVDEAELLADQINSAAAGKKEYVKVTDADQASRAQSLRSRLLELAGQAKKIHKRLKEPFLEGGRQVDAKWLTLVKLAEDTAKEIKSANDAYSTELLKAQRKAEAEADAIRLAAEKEAEMMGAPVVETAPIPVMPTQIKAGYGRAANAKPEWTLTGITDLGLVFQHFKDSAAVKECLEDLARKAIKAGGEVPGTTKEERAVTR